MKAQRQPVVSSMNKPIGFKKKPFANAQRMGQQMTHSHTIHSWIIVFRKFFTEKARYGSVKR